MHLYSLLCLISPFVYGSAALYAECYAPDGSTGNGYLPCVADIHVDSMCCVLNITALELFGDTIANLDTCLPNGMCQSNFGQYSRDLCTDKTWESPNCLNICTGGSDGGNATTSSVMTQCTDGTWCCGQQNTTDCCNKNFGFELAASIAPFAASSTAATATVGVSKSAIGMTATVTVAGATPTSPLAASSVNTNNSLGIGLGITLGVVLLAVTMVGILLFRRHRARGQGNQPGTKSPYEIITKPPTACELPQMVKIHEASHFREPVELVG